MKKLMMAAMLAMIMVAAAPAMATHKDDGAMAEGGDVQIQFQQADQEITQTATVTQSNSGDGNIGSAVSQNVEIEQNAANLAFQAGDDIFFPLFFW